MRWRIPAERINTMNELIQWEIDNFSDAERCGEVDIDCKIKLEKYIAAC